RQCLRMDNKSNAKAPCDFGFWIWVLDCPEETECDFRIQNPKSKIQNRKALALSFCMPTRILNNPTASVRVYADADELALEAARRFAHLADQYVGERGRFTVALSGGSTPRGMFTILANEPFVDTVPWSSILFFWGDERTV